MTGPRRRVVVLDYGSGNLRSAQRALERAGAEVTVTADTAAVLAADGIVVPGVIAKRLASALPVLGICVVMQILFREGVEHGLRTAGCGVLPGVVQQLTAPVLPHMGWNTVRPPDGSTLLAGIGEGTRFYFVHSYAVTAIPPPGRPAPDPPPRTGLTTHGEDFVATVEHGPLAATQFHPEKSADAGAVLLANWLGTLS